MASPYYPLKPLKGAKKRRSRVYDLEAAEPRPSIVESKRIMLKAAPETVIKAERWLRLTIIGSGSNVSVGTKSGEVANGQGFPVSESLTITLAPGSQIYASGDDGSYINVIVQPLPFKNG